MERGKKERKKREKECWYLLFEHTCSDQASSPFLKLLFHFGLLLLRLHSIVVSSLAFVLAPSLQSQNVKKIVKKKKKEKKKNSFTTLKSLGAQLNL
jgi:hypothetical protein